MRAAKDESGGFVNVEDVAALAQWLCPLLGARDVTEEVGVSEPVPDPGAMPGVAATNEVGDHPGLNLEEELIVVGAVAMRPTQLRDLHAHTLARGSDEWVPRVMSEPSSTLGAAAREAPVRFAEGC